MLNIFDIPHFKEFVHSNVYAQIKFKKYDFLEFYDKCMVFLTLLCYYYKVNLFKKRVLYVDHSDFSEIEENVYSATLPVTIENIYHECVIMYYFEKENVYLEIQLNSFKENFWFFFESNRSLCIKCDVIKDVTFEIFDVLNMYDLSCSYKINLFEYLYGTSFTINVFGSKLKFAYNGGKISSVVRENMGLAFVENGEKKKGDLYLFLELELPENTDHLKPELDDSILSIYKQLVKQYLRKLLC